MILLERNLDSQQWPLLQKLHLSRKTFTPNMYATKTSKWRSAAAKCCYQYQRDMETFNNPPSQARHLVWLGSHRNAWTRVIATCHEVRRQKLSWQKGALGQVRCKRRGSGRLPVNKHNGLQAHVNTRYSSLKEVHASSHFFCFIRACLSISLLKCRMLHDVQVRLVFHRKKKRGTSLPARCLNARLLLAVQHPSLSSHFMTSFCKSCRVHGNVKFIHHVHPQGLPWHFPVLVKPDVSECQSMGQENSKKIHMDLTSIHGIRSESCFSCILLFVQSTAVRTIASEYSCRAPGSSPNNKGMNDESL